MTTFHPWRTAVVLAAGWLVGWGAVSSHASEIRDNGKFFSPEAIAQAQKDLDALEKRSRIETRIETYETVPAEKQQAFNSLTSKAERDRFFLRWLQERAKAEKASGVFILITRKPGHLDVEMASALQRRGFGSEQRGQIRDTLVKNFKVEKFDQGLKDAVKDLETIALRLGESSSRQLAPVQGNQRRGMAAPAAGGQGMGIWGWVILGVVVWIVFSLISRLIRSATGGNRFGGGYGQPGYGQAGYGQAGYGQPGYGGYGGGGGFFSNMLGGLAGAMAGNWLYNSMSGGSHSHQAHAGQDYQSGGGDFGDDFGSGGGGGDFGGDFGGGDFGGDFGGGEGDF